MVLLLFFPPNCVGVFLIFFLFFNNGETFANPCVSAKCVLVWVCVCLLAWREEPVEVTVYVCVHHATRSEVGEFCRRERGGVWTEV